MKKKLIITLVAITSLFCLESFAQDKKQKDLAQLSVLADEEFESYESDNALIIRDPFEKYNRKVYAFNEFVDRYFLEYVAIAYRREVPKKVRKSVRNFLTNLTSPLSAVNSLLQGKTDNALATFSNFLVNSTIGVAGFINVAEEKGITYHREDFGQTLGHYRVGSGYYLMLPILGPSSTRDFAGLAVDKAVGPLDFNQLEIGGRVNAVDSGYRLALAAITGIDKREQLIDIIDDIRVDSFDPYATIRSAYLQRRLSEIKQ